MMKEWERRKRLEGGSTVYSILGEHALQVF